MLIILAILDEKHVTTILLMYLEKTCFNSFLTSSSDEEKPGTSAFVESPIRARTPSFPNLIKLFVSKLLPNVGFLSIFQLSLIPLQMTCYALRKFSNIRF